MTKPSFSIDWRALLAAIMFAVLAGCGSDRLYSDMNEQEANEIVAALDIEGISVVKSASKEGRWNIEVSKHDFARAMSILRNQNLPVQPFDGLGRVFKKEGMLATATEERARMMHAVSQEITKTL
ncbi:MAG: type III secretion system inner membrane ring lipoprotein SctJ, partial [Casimicrobium sp.]